MKRLYAVVTLPVTLALALGAGCRSQAAAPATPVATAPAEEAGDAGPTGPAAPQVHTVEELRAANPAGMTYRFRLTMADKPDATMVMEFVTVDADGAEIRQTVYDAAGAVMGTPEQARSPWSELHAHAAFPAAATVITDETVTVPAGTFPAKHYVVREGDSVTDLYFATDPLHAGPPLRLTLTGAGKPVMVMELLERGIPAPK